MRHFTRSILSAVFTFTYSVSAQCETTPQNSSISNLTDLSYGAFTQTATYSIANQLGLFTAAGLNVTYKQIPNSTYGYASLQDGTYDVLTGTIDNAVNLRFNQNASITVAGQLDQGPDLVIAAIPGIESILDLRGKNLMVDSPVSGYAYLIRKVLSLYGLQLNEDYTFLTVGSTNIRYQYLVAGQLPNGTVGHASLLTYPFTEFLADLPSGSAPTVLARVSDFINPISSSAITVATATVDESSAEHEPVVRFVAAMLNANRLLANSSQKACAVAAIAAQLNVTTGTAELEYTAATNAETGETADPQAGIFNVSRQGLLNVIDVRTQFSGFSGAGQDFNFAEAIVPGAGKLIDYSIRDEAVELVM
ncbi:putative abc periplasmic substrate-binding family protein [Neofusicoccum parvum]|nr:putative abc periplasmic substrate-binding family protein [Neofusicoccum parvum]